MQSKIDNTIQYNQSLKRDSEYRYTKLIQNTGGDSVTLLTASQTSIFEIPVVGMNLAKSFITFDQKIPENDTKAHYAHAWRHTPPWQRVELYTRSGVYLMDVTNFNHVYQAFGQRTMPISDFQGSNSGVIIKTGTNDLTVKRFSSGSATADPATGSGSVSQSWRIPGRELYNTVLSLDKTIITGEVLNLRVTWLPAQGHGFWSTDALGVTAPRDIDNLSSVTISNIAMYLAQEMNPSVLNELSQVVSTSGMSILIPYIHAYKTNLQGTSNAVSLRFSRGHGISLERVYTLTTTGAEGAATRYDSVIATNFTSFYSLLDSKRLQEFDVNVASRDFVWMKDAENKGRVVSLQLSNDINNFAFSDSWCGNDLECSIHQHISGLSLDQEKKYDVYFTRPLGVLNYNYYSVAVCQRQLLCGPSGVQVV
jgi:hypothetical protein